MTPLQKDVCSALARGMYLVSIGTRWKLYQGNQIPVMWVYNKSITEQLKSVCKDADDRGRVFISPSKVLKLRKNNYIKIQYKKYRNGSDQD